VPDRRNLQAFHPFARLTRLLDGIPPGGNGEAPILLSIGEPQNRPPDFLAEELSKAAGDWSRYPPPRGHPAYLAACHDWLTRRYGLPAEMLAPADHILPLPGTREGLFFTALSNLPEVVPGKPKPVVLMPNPCYHVYAGAAAAAGAEPVFVPATRASGFLPDYRALDPAILARTALCYLCSPSNPQGAVADLEALEGLIRLAREEDFVVAFDECYAEIYSDDPPPGALQAAARLGGSLDRVLAFHSLSKRSSAPGLRCGFAAGDADLITALDGALRVGGAGVPLPVLAAGTRLWREESHVAANRNRYRRNFALAESILGGRFDFARPAGGFFLWLEVGDGEAATKRLWREGGIRVLPGAYMCGPDAEGVNPGAGYIRVALVHDSAVTEMALGRLNEIL
jgi:aspartate/methionine/tyrosine aminotransferase